MILTVDFITEKDIPKILEWESLYFGGQDNNMSEKELYKYWNKEIVLGVYKGFELVAYFVFEETVVESTLYLVSMSINPDYKGKGISKDVTKLVIDYIQEEGWDILMLSVEEPNISAIKLYESVGFNKLKKISDPEYYEGPDFYVMMRVL